MLYKKVFNHRARQRPANHDANSRYNPLLGALLSWKIGLAKFLSFVIFFYCRQKQSFSKRRSKYNWARVLFRTHCSAQYLQRKAGDRQLMFHDVMGSWEEFKIQFFC